MSSVRYVPMISDREKLKKLLKENSILRGKFTLSSGKESDYYIDARLTTLHPEGLYLVGKIFLEDIVKSPEIKAVGGPTMGADPIVGSILALSIQKGHPLLGFIVRKGEKDHGTGKLIEGNLKSGHSVAIVEDVMTTGRSIFWAIDAVEKSGALVKKVLVIVDREEGGKETIEQKGYEFFSIFQVGEFLE
ncbi:MAG: orotate phosphoribosyltransferase [Thermodesulfobacteriota bacterium]